MPLTAVDTKPPAGPFLSEQKEADPAELAVNAHCVLTVYAFVKEQPPTAATQVASEVLEASVQVPFVPPTQTAASVLPSLQTPFSVQTVGVAASTGPPVEQAPLATHVASVVKAVTEQVPCEPSVQVAAVLVEPVEQVPTVPHAVSLAAPAATLQAPAT